MSDKKCLRRHLFVDPKVQGALILRVVLYWCVCLISMALMMLCWQLLTSTAEMMSLQFNDMWRLFYKPALIASCLLLPMVIMDIIRFSNRFVGPLLRLRRSMRQLARGEQVEPLVFRDTDFWHDTAKEFNAIRSQILASTAPPTVDHKEEEEEEEELAAVG
jgi:hypothetical protein